MNIGIMPSHGRMARFANLEEKKKAFVKGAADFEAKDPYDSMFSIGYS